MAIWKGQNFALENIISIQPNKLPNPLEAISRFRKFQHGAKCFEGLRRRPFLTLLVKMRKKLAASEPENQARFTIDNLIGGKFDLERPKEAFKLR